MTSGPGRGSALRLPRPPRARSGAGFTLLELLLVVALVLVLAGVAVPWSASALEGAKARGAARYVAARFSLARAQAVARTANVAVAFSAASSGVVLASYQDGNGNGVRVADIASGADVLVDGPVGLAELFPGVALTINSPTAPPLTGSTTLMSFTASGTASSGTIYLRGRDASQYGVRVLGATGRTRVLRYLAPKDQWVPVF